MNPQLVFIQVSAVLQIAFTLCASVDALWFHLYKLRLHARPETRKEHVLHSANACLFPITLVFLYCFNAGGAALWAGIAATLVTFGIEIVDVGHEKTSRAGMGGVSAIEGVMHFGMGVGRALAFAFVVASKPLDAFLLSSPWVLATAYPDWVLWMGRIMFLTALPMAALHLALCAPRFSVRSRAPQVAPQAEALRGSL